MNREWPGMAIEGGRLLLNLTIRDGARRSTDQVGIGTWFRRHMSIFANRPELLGSFREGRREALEQVYRHYVRQIDVYLRTLSGAAGRRGIVSSSGVADLIQEVFVRAFSISARAAIEPTRDYAAYLKAIARNAFVDTLRTQQREQLIGETDWPGNVQRCEESDSLSDPKVRAIVTAYLRDLPIPLRGVYEQRYVLGRSQDAACSALGLTRRNLRTGEKRLKRGLLQALRAKGLGRRDVVSSLGEISEAK